jgi:hypothetical protein
MLIWWEPPAAPRTEDPRPPECPPGSPRMVSKFLSRDSRGGAQHRAEGMESHLGAHLTDFVQQPPRESASPADAGGSADRARIPPQRPSMPKRLAAKQDRSLLELYRRPPVRQRLRHCLHPSRPWTPSCWPSRPNGRFRSKFEHFDHPFDRICQI